MTWIAKLFIAVFCVIVIAAVCLWIIGGKSTTHSTRLVIDAAPASVFPFLTDGEKVKQWGDGIIEVGTFEDPELTPEFSSSPTYKRIVTRGQEDIEYTDAILRYQADEYFSIQSSNSNVVQTSIFNLSNSGANVNQTQFEYRVKTTHVGMGRLFAPFAEDLVEERIISEAKNLKELVESLVDSDSPQPLSSLPDPAGSDENVITASFEQDSNSNSRSESNEDNDSKSEFGSLFGTGK